ncbi:MAG: hypothetical protein L3K14_07195 [Thermoplasmata archaeon]|nr:hypothetical protein [Thermoplasmata archaeon]
MGEELDSLEQSLLRHLLTYRGHQVRFEADAHTTEFGIYRSFTDLESGVLKGALRQLEAGRWVYRRVQYVIGFSEPKLVYSLTPHGYRKALDLFGPSAPTPSPATPAAVAGPTNGPAPVDPVPVTPASVAAAADDSPPNPSAARKSPGKRHDRPPTPAKQE